MWTTIPASIIGLIVWFCGLNSQGNVNTKQIKVLLNELSSIYNINFCMDSFNCDYHLFNI